MHEDIKLRMIIWYHPSILLFHYTLAQMRSMAPRTDVNCVGCVCLHMNKSDNASQVFVHTWPKQPVTMAMGKWIPAEARVRLHESKKSFPVLRYSALTFTRTTNLQGTVQNKVTEEQQETSAKYKAYWFKYSNSRFKSGHNFQ